MKPGEIVTCINDVTGNMPAPGIPGVIIRELSPDDPLTDGNFLRSGRQFQVLFSSGVFTLYEFILRPLDETR